MVVNAQKKALPEDVSKALSEKYPTAEDVKFKVKKDIYRVRFKTAKMPVVAVYTNKGEWISSETDLTKKDMPEEVNSAILKKYPKGTYSKGKLLETPENAFYQISVDTQNAVYNLEINKNGKILKTEKVVQPKEDSNSGGGGDMGGGEE